MPGVGRVAVVIALATGALVATAGLAVWSFASARAAALRATDALEAGRLSASADDYRAAAADFHRAERALAVLRVGVGWVPVVSGNVRLAHAEARAGQAAAEGAGHLAALLQVFRKSRTALETGPLRVRSHGLEGIVIDLERSLQELSRAPEPSWAVPALRDGRSPLLEDGSRLLATLRVSRAAVLLASPGRTYLLVIQNPAELRATGGLIGAWGLLRTGLKRVRLLRLAPDTALPVPRSPVAAPPSYQTRYGRFGANRGWVNANMSPDFPTSAQVLLRLYRSATGEELDGVLALDAVALARLTGAVGPIEAGGQRLTRETFVEAVLVRSYQRPSPARVDMLLAAAREGWRRLETGAPRVRVARALAAAAGTGHVRAFALDPRTQESLAAAGIAGAVDTKGGDYLMLVRQNAGGNKLDPYLHTRLAHTIALRDNGTARSRLAITLTNEAPRRGLSDYAVGALEPGEPPSLSRGYLSVYASPTAELVSFRAGGQRTAESAEELGHRVFSWYQDVPPGARRQAVLELESGLVAERRGDFWSYRLVLQSQPELNPRPFTLTLQLPEDARLREILGPNPRITGSRVRFTATLDRDRVVSVTYCFCRS